MQVAETAASSLRATLVDRRAVGPDASILELEIPGMPANLAPGKFAMLSPAEGGTQQIARPFSVYDRPSANRFTFIIQQLGQVVRYAEALLDREDWRDAPIRLRDRWHPQWEWRRLEVVAE